MIPTRGQLMRLVNKMGDWGDLAAENDQDSLALECYQLQLDAANALNCHVTEENKWLWEGEFHKPVWTYRSNMYHALSCECGETFADMMEIEAIIKFFSHLAIVHYEHKIKYGK